MVRVAFYISLFFLSLSVYANKRIYTTQKISGEVPKIDGMIIEPVWDEVDWSGDFVQTIPYEKRKPSQETRFKILYDDNNLYIAIRCFDTSPDSIDSRLTRRDDFGGDWVGISFDSYHDLLTAFTFTVNAAGVKGDGIHSQDGYNFDENWDPIWKVKTLIDSEGWTAEMEIPLTQIRFGDKEEHIWGIQLLRNIYRKGEESLWQFKSPKTTGWVSHYGELHGIKNIQPRKQKDITPYVVGKYETYKKEEENPFSKGNEYHGSVGIDSKIGITNDLIMDLTINPDFGQVEADPSEVNLSTFETMFDEKRPFFIEGNNILDYRILPYGGDMSQDNIFYSRRIGKKPGYSPDPGGDYYLDMPGNTTILSALKLTGKTQKGWSVGIIESVTQKEIAEVDTNGTHWNEEVEPLTNYFVGRIQKDLNNSNTKIGGIFTSTNRNITSSAIEDLFPKEAYTGGFDFQHFWKDKTYKLLINTEFSHIRGSEEAIYESQIGEPYFFQREDAEHLKTDSTKKSLTGFGGTLNFGREGNGKWMYTAWITWRSPGLRLNEVGYLRDDDKIQQVFWAGYREHDPIWIFRFIGLNFNQWIAFTFGGEELYRGINYNNHFQLKNFWQFGFGASRNGKSLSMWELRGGPALRYDGSMDYFGYISTNDRKKITISFNYNGFSQDKSMARSNNFNLGFNFRLIDELEFSLDTRYSRRFNDIQYIDNVDYDNETVYIRGRMDQDETAIVFRLNLNLSPDFTIQYYGMPFISAGKYTNLKYIIDSKASDVNKRYINYQDNQYDYDPDEKVYYIDENVDNQNDYSFDNPDFNAYDFNSNLVVRWEYRPGSLLYLVWSQNRNDWVTRGDFNFGSDVQDLFEIFPHNIFLIKLSYRIGL